MSSIAQTLANRQNSQKSTGPRSAEGKAVVAKNAVKHGLFAQEAVITGENTEEYELFRDEILAELAPAGAMEAVLAERAVSLSWRLQRIERIQNLVIDSMIEREVSNPLANLTRQFLPKSLRKPQSDANSGDGSSDMTLGKIAIKDCANSRVLDRLLMYERRIENSLFKTMAELQRRKLMRQLGITDEELSPDMDQPHPATIEQSPAQDKMTSHPHPDKRHQDEAATQSQKNGKQSQYSPSDMNVTSFARKNYSEILRPGTTQKQSQFIPKGSQSPAFPRPATAFAVTSDR